MARTLERLTPIFLNRVGTGALETIAHGQNAVPVLVQVQPMIYSATYTQGAHTKDAVLITVELNKVYSLVVWF